MDYAPKTEVQSDIEGPIQFKITDDQSGSLGVSLDGGYGRTLSGNLGTDRSSRHSDSRQFNKTPQMNAVTAAGTINRGRGVYFKLRRTAKQVLEGEKVFRITLRVPENWRGSLLDVQVVAQSSQKLLGGWDRKVKTLGASHFVVAAYNHNDVQAANVSRRLAAAEQVLREASWEQSDQGVSLGSFLHHIARRLSLEETTSGVQSIRRILQGEADPYLDKEIQKLPMQIRLAVLEYCDLRDEFDQLQSINNTSHLAID